MKVYILNLSRSGFEMALVALPGSGLINETAFKDRLAQLGLIENCHYIKSKKCLHTYEVQGVVNTVNVLMSLPQDMIEPSFYSRGDGQPINHGIIGARYATTITVNEFGMGDQAILRKVDVFLFQVLKNFIAEHLSPRFSKNSSIVELLNDIKQIEQISDIDFFENPRYLLGYCCIYRACCTANNEKRTQTFFSLSFFRSSPLLKILNEFMYLYKEEFAPSLKQITPGQLTELYVQNFSLAKSEEILYS